MKPTLLVLAAGRGTRFGGLKQMEPVGPRGETVLDYSVFDAARVGFGRVVFVVGADFAQAFEARVRNRYAGALGVACICQRLDDLPPGHAVPPGRTRPWGTLHAAWSARDVLDGPFCVINADDFYGREAFERMAGFFSESETMRSDAPGYCMVGYELARTLSGGGGVNRGICALRDGFLAGVMEHRDIVAEAGQTCRATDPAGRRVQLAANAIASMNVWGFTPAILGPMAAYFAQFLHEHGTSLDAECYLPAMMNQLICEHKARCRVLQGGSGWFGITYAADRERCVQAIIELVAAGQYAENLWGGP